jgi:homoserine O-acetyltransferase
VSHPPLQPGWIDRPHETLPLGDFPLESGEVIRDFRLSYVTHGTGAETILALSAIGSTHHRLDAWIGPGKALDAARFRILCIDAIGNGLTTSPSNGTAQPRLRFPRFTIRDMVESQHRLVEHLGIARLHAVVGASMGGMQALQWGASYPTAMKKIVALVPMAKTTAWSVAVNEASRRALMADPAWPDGKLEAGWAAWTAIMQVLAGRTPEKLAGIEDPVRHIEERTRQRAASGFDAVDWVYQTWAYDAHDVGDLAAIEAETLVMAPPVDLYNPAAEAGRAAREIRRARFIEIPTADGHQCASGADAADTAFIDRAMAEFLSS